MFQNRHARLDFLHLALIHTLFGTVDVTDGEVERQFAVTNWKVMIHVMKHRHVAPGRSKDKPTI